MSDFEALLLVRVDKLIKQNEKLKYQLKIAKSYLEKINTEELNSQRPGGGYSRSASLSFNALREIKLLDDEIIQGILNEND